MRSWQCPHGTPLLLFFGLLVGCEAVAGIKDFSLSGEDAGTLDAGDDDGNGSTSPDATGDAADAPSAAPDATQGDASEELQAASDAPGVVVDGAARDAFADGATRDAAVDGAVTDAAAPTDATLVNDAGTADASDASLATEASAPPDTGATADGGSLSCGQPSTSVLNPIIYTGSACSTIIPAPRNGFWFSYNDMLGDGGLATALASTAGGCLGSSDCGIHVVAPSPGFQLYAGAGFNLAGGSTNVAYDASAYAGIEFSAKGSVVGSRAGNNVSGFVAQDNTIFVELVGPTSRPMGDEYGAYCVLDADPTVWTHCEVDFATAKRLGLAPPPDGADLFDSTNLLKVLFQLAPATEVSADVWFDDVYFK